MVGGEARDGWALCEHQAQLFAVAVDTNSQDKSPQFKLLFRCIRSSRFIHLYYDTTVGG